MRLLKTRQHKQNERKPHIALPLSFVYSNKWRWVVKNFESLLNEEKDETKDPSHVGQTIRRENLRKLLRS